MIILKQDYKNITLHMFEYLFRDLEILYNVFLYCIDIDCICDNIILTNQLTVMAESASLVS